MNQHPPLYLVIGPSGAGKTTIVDRLLKRPELGLQRFITTTTRPPRPNEKPGDPYWFTSPDIFERMIEEKAFFEWAKVYGHYYGANKAELQRLEDLGKPIIYIIDMQGAVTMKRLLPDATILFIDAPRDQLIRRLKERQTSETDLKTRIELIDREQAQRSLGDAVFVNSDDALDKTVDAVADLIRQRM